MSVTIYVSDWDKFPTQVVRLVDKWDLPNEEFEHHYGAIVDDQGFYCEEETLCPDLNMANGNFDLLINLIGKPITKGLVPLEPDSDGEMYQQLIGNIDHKDLPALMSRLVRLANTKEQSAANYGTYQLDARTTICGFDASRYLPRLIEIVKTAQECGCGIHWC